MVTILTSFTVRRSHSGRTAPCWTKNLICAALPPLVALLTAHAASFRMSNSALLNSWTNGGTMLLSTTAWIWSLFPAVMLEMVPRDDVPHGPEGRRLDGRAGVEEELHEAAADAGLDDRLDLLVGAVGQVAQGPAGVRQHL